MTLNKLASKLGMSSDANTYNPPPLLPLEFLHLDSDLLVVNKPTGLLSVPGRGENKTDCLITRVQNDYPDALVIHRLDMETSGIVLFARNKKCQRLMGTMFEKRLVRKKYTAVVNGDLENSEGIIDSPLIADWPNRPRQKIDFENGKPSSTNYQLIKYDADRNESRVGLKPITGRSHQLRVHMMSIGHAIIGDRLYAGECIASKSDRLLLHAEQIDFNHPVTDRNIKIICKTPF